MPGMGESGPIQTGQRSETSSGRLLTLIRLRRGPIEATAEPDKMRVGKGSANVWGQECHRRDPSN